MSWYNICISITALAAAAVAGLTHCLFNSSALIQCWSFIFDYAWFFCDVSSSAAGALVAAPFVLGAAGFTSAAAASLQSAGKKTFCCLLFMSIYLSSMPKLIITL